MKATTREAFARRHVHLAERLGGAAAPEGALPAWREQCADPDALLDRWLDGVEFKADCAIALSGVGDGSHIRAVLRRLPEGSMVFCAEPDVGRFAGFLETDGAEDLLDDPRVLFGIGVADDMFYRSLASFDIMSYTSAEPLIFAPYFQEDEAYYGAFFLEFARQLELWRKMFGTNLTESGHWQRNTFSNLRRLVGTPDPILMQNAFAGLPLIMAGAGPSLDESLEFLRWAQDRAVIVAGNSSIRALVRGGVRPHFVLAADPNESTDRGFEGVALSETVLLCPFMVNTAVPPRFAGRIAAWSFGNPVASYFRKVSGRDREAFVTEQGTVSACAFDIAVILGCPSVYFVGQDLAARTDGRMHASDSFYADMGPDSAELSKCRWMPGNTLESVPVEEKLFVYLKTFSELAHAYGVELKLKNGKGLDLYNLSRLGARIDGFPYLDFEHARKKIEAAGGGEVGRGWRAVKNLLATHSVGWGRVGKALSEIAREVDALCSKALKHALAFELGTADLELARKDAAAIEAFLASDVPAAQILNEGQLKLELHMHRRASALMGRTGAGEGAAREAENLTSYFWAVAEGAFHLRVSIEGVSQEKALAGDS